MTPDEFRECMDPLGAHPWHYGKGLTRPVMRLYWAAFHELDAAVFAKAVLAHLGTSNEFPTIADLRRALGQGGGSLAEAGAVFEALTGPAPHYDPRRGDYWALPDVMERFGAQALAGFLAAGGTSAFRDRSDREVSFLRRDFLRGWEEFAARPEAPSALLTHGDPTRRGLGPITESLPRLLPSEAKVEP